MPVLILWMLACGGGPEVDPELRRLGRAVEATERGEAALRSGDAGAAVIAFEQARDVRPDDALIAAWQAEASLAAGDVEAARRLADDAVALQPGYGPARLIRARLAASAGDVDTVGDDLRSALSSGVITPRAVLREPAFAALVPAPELDFLPAAPLEARLTGPERLAFWGSEIEVVLEVDGALAGPVSLAPDGVQGPASLGRVVEDDVVGLHGDRTRRIRWALRVEGAGEVVVGPLEVVQDGERATTDVLRVPTDAPEGRAPAASTARLRTPTEVLGDRVPPTAWRDGDLVWVALPPGARLDPVAGAQVGGAWVLQRDGELVAELVPVRGVVEEVTVRSGGDVLWQGRPAD